MIYTYLNNCYNKTLKYEYNIIKPYLIDRELKENSYIRK